MVGNSPMPSIEPGSLNCQPAPSNAPMFDSNWAVYSMSMNPPAGMSPRSTELNENGSSTPKPLRSRNRLLGRVHSSPWQDDMLRPPVGPAPKPDFD
jgi:hypothetical protein